MTRETTQPIPRETTSSGDAVRPGPRGPPAIELRGLVKRFDQLTAVDGIDLRVEKGECLGLLGPNGAGKTTTLEILEGLQKPTSGEVRVLGLEWRTAAAEIRSRIGVQLQETHFYERLTAIETLRLYRSFYARGLTAEDALERVQLGEKRDAQVGNLSGGQRQRLALAVAMVGDPDLLFLDEPTTGLDPQARRAVWDAIDRIKGDGRSLVLTTHYMEEAHRLCDRIVVVDRGRVVAEGTPESLIARLGGAHLLDLELSPANDPSFLATAAGVLSVTPQGGKFRLAVRAPAQAIPAILAAAAENGCQVVHLNMHEPTLEDVFLTLTGRSLREGES